MQVAALGRAVLDGIGVSGGRRRRGSTCQATAVRWSTATRNCRWSPPSDEELAIDLEPFERLRWAPMGMVAHVVYTAWDPELPSSMSPTVIRQIIRERIGFDNLLMTDDLGCTHCRAIWARVLPGRSPPLRHRPSLLRRDGRNAIGRRRHSGAIGRGRGAARDGRWPTLNEDDEIDFAEAVAKRDALLALV
jgi:beta-N-acetylhexosaminidase